ncbi:MAG: hypothetical protein WA414_17610 [Acidobacteriaceae bacterium]
MTLNIEHREFSFSTGPGGIAAREAGKGGNLERPGREGPATCPACGGAAVLLLPEVLAERGFAQATVERSATGSGLHMGRTPSGEWWVCRDSIEGR